MTLVVTQQASRWILRLVENQDISEFIEELQQLRSSEVLVEHDLLEMVLALEISALPESDHEIQILEVRARRDFHHRLAITRIEAVQQLADLLAVVHRTHAFVIFVKTVEGLT